MGSVFEHPASTKAEGEQLAGIVEPIQETELALGLDLFGERSRWMDLLANDARQGVEEMLRIAERAIHRGKPEAFLHLAGLENGSRENAETAVAEFIKNGKDFLIRNQMLAPVSYLEAAGNTPGDSGRWLRDIRDDLYGALKADGPENIFREQQARYLATQPVKEEGIAAEYKKTA